MINENWKTHSSKKEWLQIYVKFSELKLRKTHQNVEIKPRLENYVWVHAEISIRKTVSNHFYPVKKNKNFVKLIENKDYNGLK
jgi:hypothetical protein